MEREKVDAKRFFTTRRYFSSLYDYFFGARFVSFFSLPFFFGVTGSIKSNHHLQQEKPFLDKNHSL